MPTARPTLQNFTRGQLSPRMRGRYDLDFYYAGCEELVNFIPDIEGSITFRQGTEFLYEAPNKTWLRKFEFSQSESYNIGFSNHNIRIYTPEGDIGVNIPTDYLEEDIPYLQIAQAADTMYIAHVNYKPKRLVRTGANTFSFSDHVVTGQTDLDFTNANNYPAAVSIYEKRLIYAGTTANPQAVYMSQSFLYNNFDLGTGQDDEGIKYVIGSNRLNRIKTVSSTQDTCVVSTTGGDFNVSSGSTGDSITPTRVRIVSNGTRGTEGLQPVEIDNALLYMEAGARKLNSYQYVFESDGFKTIDQTTLSYDITESGINNIAFASGEPDRVLMVRNDGKAVNLTWKPEQSVYGFSLLETDGKYISVSATPQLVGDDRVMYCVERVINGVTKYYIEVEPQKYLLPERENYFTGDKEADENAYILDMYEAQKSYKFVDSCLTFNGLDRGISASADISLTVAADGASADVVASAPLFTANDVNGQIRARVGEGWGTVIEYTSDTEVKIRIDREFDETSYVAGDYYITADTISGLTHLEGKDVAILVDGAPNDTRTVSGGVVTLSDDGKRQGSVIHVGLGYTGKMRTMNLEGAQTDGSTQTKRKKVTSVNILFLQSLGCSYGTDIYKTDQLLFQNTGNRFNRPPLPFSGVKVARADDRTERVKRLVALQNRPLPCIIQLVQPKLDTSS